MDDIEEFRVGNVVCQPRYGTLYFGDNALKEKTWHCIFLEDAKYLSANPPSLIFRLTSLPNNTLGGYFCQNDEVGFCIERFGFQLIATKHLNKRVTHDGLSYDEKYKYNSTPDLEFRLYNEVNEHFFKRCKNIGIRCIALQIGFYMKYPSYNLSKSYNPIFVSNSVSYDGKSLIIGDIVFDKLRINI